MKQAHVFISGRVQGVFFRYHTRLKAEEIGLTGWVKNLPDGRVEAVFEGDKERVERMVDWCWNQGSPASEVEDVELTWGKATKEFEGFTIRR